MSRGNSELDRLREGRTELENHYIDELVSGNVSRGSSSKTTTGAAGTSTTSSAPATKGGTLRIGAVTPAAAINPLTISDAGGLLMLNQTG